MATDLCTGCHKPAPRDWCWEGRDLNCPLGIPPRVIAEGGSAAQELWRMLWGHIHKGDS